MIPTQKILSSPFVVNPASTQVYGNHWYVFHVCIFYFPEYHINELYRNSLSNFAQYNVFWDSSKLL